MRGGTIRVGVLAAALAIATSGLAVPATAESTAEPVLDNFELLGHSDLGADSTYGDIWVHEDTAYVGTWVDPCEGAGVQIVDVSDLASPTPIGRLAEREASSAEDVVVRSVNTSSFNGDLLAVGLQACGGSDTINEWGLGLWDVSDPTAPVELSFLTITHGGGGVHELDLFQRGPSVYAVLASPQSEWFEEPPLGDVIIADVSDPANPTIVGQWSARAEGLSTGPYDGMGNFADKFAHSVRVSNDGTKVFASYWDLGVITLDIADPANPQMVTRTMYPPGSEGDAHSVVEYETPDRSLLLQMDEDANAKSPVRVLFDGAEQGEAAESTEATALYDEPQHQVTRRVIRARRQGCAPEDFPRKTDGKIVVVKTHLHYFDEGPTERCRQGKQESLATRAGAAAVVHDWISSATAPSSSFEFYEARIPVVYADHALAQGMVAAGRATLEATPPSWGYLRVFDADTGEQVAQFDSMPGVHDWPPPEGEWTIHNTEVIGDRGYASWYSNGIVALDLTPLHEDPPADPVQVGQFVPEPTRATVFGDVAAVWGVFVRDDGVIFASDMGSGLWIVRPTGEAAA